MGSTAAMALPPQISGWLEGLRVQNFSELVPASRTAVFCTDMTIRFCRKGRLASPAIDALTEPVVELFRRAQAPESSCFFKMRTAEMRRNSMPSRRTASEEPKRLKRSPS